MKVDVSGDCGARCDAHPGPWERQYCLFVAQRLQHAALLAAVPLCREPVSAQEMALRESFAAGGSRWSQEGQATTPVSSSAGTPGDRLARDDMRVHVLAF